MITNKMYLAIISFTQAIHSAKSCVFSEVSQDLPWSVSQCFAKESSNGDHDMTLGNKPMQWRRSLSSTTKTSAPLKSQQRTWTTSKKFPEYCFAFPFELTRRLKLQSWEALRRQQGHQSTHWYGHMCSTLSDLNSLSHRAVSWSSLQALELSGVGHFSCHKD